MNSLAGTWVQGSEVRVQGSGFRLQGSGFSIQGSGFRIQGSWFKAQGDSLSESLPLSLCPPISLCSLARSLPLSLSFARSAGGEHDLSVVHEVPPELILLSL